MRASSGVMSPIRTRRATAEAKFGRRKIANDHDWRVCSEECVGSRCKSIDNQQCHKYARVQINAHRVFFIAKICQKRTGTLRGRNTSYPMLGKPIQVGLCYCMRRLHDGLDQDDEAAVARDHDLLTFERAFD
jgi:hypothetical protein